MTTFKIDIDCVLQADAWWLVGMGGGDDPVFTFREADYSQYRGLAAFEAMSPEEQEKFLALPNQFNPWLMRETFFKINNPADALEFLREYGVWRFSRFDGDEPSNRFSRSWARGEGRDPLPICFSELIYQRNFFEDALNSKPADWVDRASVTTGNLKRDAALLEELMYLYGVSGGFFDISIVNFQGSIFPGPFKGSIVCGEIQDALRATILLDWMEGREWPRCKACRRVFKRTSKHPQFYCCPACSSRARQATFRKSRANQTGGEA